ncbi:MAG TPA: hypothetical protein VIM58_12155 [Candidatus Methylacidiphilales bacterium]
MNTPVRMRHGFALVSTLGFLTLLTIVLITFVSVVAGDQKSTNNYVKGIQADTIAHSGLDQILCQIESEITDTNGGRAVRLVNASVPASSAYPVYRPLVAKGAAPERMANLPADPDLLNIVKASLPGAPFYTTPNAAGTNLASSVLTTSNSLNGRSVGLRRWDFPQLVPARATNRFPIPAWVYVGKNGPMVLAAKEPVLGRYAYVVYDTSGLLDITVAGRPTSVATANRGILPWADLTQLTNALSQDDVDALVKWRNAASAANYAAYVTNWSTNGFLRTASGDTTFLNRQELLKFASRSGNGDWAAVLPYLTTFSRELNGPVWGPPADAPYGAPYDYTTHQYQATTVTHSVPVTTPLGGTVTVYNNNVFLLNPRIAADYTNNFGILRRAGEPLVKYRFPLDKLGLLESATNAAAWNQNKAEIQKYFGLDYVTSGNDPSADLYHHWSYPTANPAYNYGGVANRILTLDEVAKLKRDPNFFELLQAGILSGSLGRDGRGDTALRPAGVDPDANIGYQLIRIGANIIDQWSSNNCPTTITFDGSDFYGVKDLPYISKCFYKCSGDPHSGDASPPATTAQTDHPMIYFELWNPHAATANSGLNRPTNFRLIPSPDDVLDQPKFNYYLYPSGTYINFSYSTWIDGTKVGTINLTSSKFNNSGVINFTASSSDYRNPSLMTAVGSSNPSLIPSAYLSGSILGIVFNDPLRWTYPSGYTPPSGNTLTINYSARAAATFQIQYEWPVNSGSYHTYGTFVGLYSSATKTSSWAMNMNALIFPSGWTSPQTGTNAHCYLKPDPRTSRWAAANSSWTWYTDRPNNAGTSLMPSSSSAASNYYLLETPFILNATNSTSRIDLLAVNTNSVSVSPSPYYLDKDNVQRIGDAALSYGANHSPYYANDSSKPLVLNRAFTSVGDLGYAYRDIPWRTLNFYSADSADAALLDLFTLSDGAVVAGRVNPNAASIPVLRALLGGVALGSPSGGTVSPAAVSAVASSFRGIATNSSFVSRADIVAKYMGASASASSLGAFSSSNLKTEREAALRSLVESSNTRTWNLLVDVIAQSGRHPAGIAAPESFIVEGERRYWLHLAIDRYTGEVIDKQLELVSE